MKNNNYPNWLVPLEIAKKLKELGFDIECAFFYDDILKEISFDEEDVSLINWNKKSFTKCVSLPTWEQVFEWFREKGFDSYIGLESHPYPDEGIYYYFEISKPNLYRINQLAFQGDFDDYNEAREALVKALIQTYKNEQL